MARRVLIGFLIILALAFGGVARFDHLATRPIETSEFSTINKVEIYVGYLAMMAVGFPLYPEISAEMWFMLFPTSRDREIVFSDDFFMESIVVRQAIESFESRPLRLYWQTKDYLLGSSEARVALTFNGGYLTLEDDKVVVRVPCSWPKYTNYSDPSEKTPLLAWPEISVQEGLFWILEQEGWIHPYTAKWVANR